MDLTSKHIIWVEQPQISLEAHIPRSWPLLCWLFKEINGHMKLGKVQDEIIEDVCSFLPAPPKSSQTRGK